MAEFVQQRIAALLTMPDAWGAPESVELQLFLLLEMEHVVHGSPRDVVNDLQDRYRRYLGYVLPGQPVALAVRLGLGERATPRFVELLRGFVEEERTRRGLLRPRGVPILPARDRSGPVHIEA
jgi:hypothetical protein